MACFYGLLLFANSSTGMRSSFLRRQLGIGGKSALRLGNTIRTHMATFEPFRRIGGPKKLVHIDEAFLKYMRNGCRQSPHIVMGIECEGEVRCGLLENRTLPTIMNVINRNIRRGSILVTDCHLAYSGLKAAGWDHIAINHTKAFHNFSGMTNNPIEVFWSVLKRTMRLYQHVEPRNLWRYLAEIQFRYNRRNTTSSPFNELLTNFPHLEPVDRGHLCRPFYWSDRAFQSGLSNEMHPS